MNLDEAIMLVVRYCAEPQSMIAWRKAMEAACTLHDAYVDKNNAYFAIVRDRNVEKHIRKDAEHALADAADILEDLAKRNDAEALEWLGKYDPVRLENMG